MDYPKSVPGIALDAGKFTDGNPVTGKQASLNTASWANGITDEILNVIIEYVGDPDEQDNTQLLQAFQAAVQSWDNMPVGFSFSTEDEDLTAILLATGKWKKKNGDQIEEADFSEYFAIRGYKTTPVAEQGLGYFRLPDSRGRFPRYTDLGAGIDPDAGSVSGLSADTTNESETILNAPDISGYEMRRYIGSKITGTGIPANTRILGWTGTTITMNSVATATASVSDIAIDFDVAGSKQKHALQGHAIEISTNNGTDEVWTSVFGKGDQKNGDQFSSANVATSNAMITGDFISDGVHGSPQITYENRPISENETSLVKVKP
jgi:hypothetical protein